MEEEKIPTGPEDTGEAEPLPEKADIVIDLRQPEAEQEAVEEPSGLPALEEHTEPLPEEPEPLAEGHMLTDDDGHEFRVLRLVSHGAIRRYSGETVEDGGPSGPVFILHAINPAADDQLKRIGQLLSDVKSPMLPDMVSSFRDEDSSYLVIADPQSPTLAEALESGIELPRLINILAQVAAGLSKIHEVGWLHLGLQPEEIYLSKPVRILGLEHVLKQGEKPSESFYIPGYSPPELLQEQAPDPRADIYSVGAIFYHGVTGTPIGEKGLELLSWQPPNPVPGVPQILNGCLGDRDGRYHSASALHKDLLKLARRLAPTIDYIITADTTIGLEPTRTTNQDAYSFIQESIESDEGPENRAVVCVADGMGGMAAGEVASRVAVTTVINQAMDVFRDSRVITADQQVKLVKDFMQAANDSAVSALEERRARGGCTMVCAFLIERRLAISHVGDCRIYLIRDDNISQLTQDHSLAVALVLQGQIEMHEVRDHPDRNMVTRSLGDRRPLPDYNIDTLEQVTGNLTMELRTGDILLLCSDGLWEPVLENEMLDAVRKHSPDLNAAAGVMIKMVLDRGAPDNATVALLRLDEIPALYKEDDTSNA